METKKLFGWSQISTNCSGCPAYLDPETDELVEPESCDGICYEDDRSCLDDLIDEWRQHNSFEKDTLIRIDGSAMGWRGISGYKDCLVVEVAEALYLNGEFTIRYELTEDFVLTAQRWSHDEPTGSGIFTFKKSPLNKCGACGEIDETTRHEDYDYCPVCLEMRIG